MSGKYTRGAPPPADSRLALRPEGHAPSEAFFDAMARFEAEAAKRGCSAGALALAWVLARPGVTAAAAGPSRRPEHLRLAREALQVALDEEAHAAIASWFERAR